MRIDEAAHQEPRPIECRRLVLQPVHRLEGSAAVEHGTLKRRAEHLAPLLEIGEAVALERVLARRAPPKSATCP